jgi:hyperosmotically inducible periplasmic protein
MIWVFLYLCSIGILGRQLLVAWPSWFFQRKAGLQKPTQARGSKKRRNMRSNILSGAMLTMLAVGIFPGCSSAPTKSVDVADTIRQSLTHAGLKDVSVSQDRDKGVVILTGTTTSQGDKSQAESIARSIGAGQVISDQIAVRPPGGESLAKKVDADLDGGIEKNFDAVLIQHKLDSDVKYDVKNGVITLTGKVNSQARRDSVEHLAAGVPNVKQVVNELEVRDQKASSTD